MNARDDSGTTLLGLAARRGHLGILKLLLEAGANPAIRDLNGRDPSEIARANGFYDIVKLLSTHSGTAVSEPELHADVPEESIATALPALSFEETSHYQITLGMLDDPRRYWAYLLDQQAGC